MFFLSLFAYFEFIPWDDLPPCSIVEGDYWILSLYFDHVQCSIPGIFKENSCTFSVSTFLVYKHTSYLSPKILLCDGDLRHFVARKFSLFYAFFKRCKKMTNMSYVYKLKSVDLLGSCCTLPTVWRSEPICSQGCSRA